MYILDLIQCVPMNFARKYFVNFNPNVMIMQFRNKSWPVKFVNNSLSATLVVHAFRSHVIRGCRLL